MKKTYNSPEMYVVYSAGEEVCLDPAINNHSKGTTLDDLAKDSQFEFFDEDADNEE